jgi:hypothetical protein
MGYSGTILYPGHYTGKRIKNPRNYDINYVTVIALIAIIPKFRAVIIYIKSPPFCKLDVLKLVTAKYL